MTDQGDRPLDRDALAGEGTDDDEATITKGPGTGGTAGRVGTGTADEVADSRGTGHQDTPAQSTGTGDR
jgi:hypothetical protein